MIDIESAWEELHRRIASCRKCDLCDMRHHTVPGEGPHDCRVVIIGEGPGKEEDESGRPFVGQAGRLLTDILEKGGGIDRKSLYITNMVKCRPPNNRDPNEGEINACRDFLEAQLLLIHPDIVVTLGNVPSKPLLNTTQGITSMRGDCKNWRGIKLFPMFHPSHLLHNQSNAVGSPKYLTWQDVKKLKAEIDKLKNKSKES